MVQKQGTHVAPHIHSSLLRLVVLAQSNLNKLYAPIVNIAYHIILILLSWHGNVSSRPVALSTVAVVYGLSINHCQSEKAQ